MSRRSDRAKRVRPACEVKASIPPSLYFLDDRPVFCLVVPWMALGGADRCGMDLMSYYKDRGFRVVVVATRTIRADCRRESSFSAIADEVHLTEDVVSVVAKLQPTYTVVNNSHEAYEQAEAIKEAAPATKLVSLFHMILNTPWDFEKSLQRGTSFDLVLTVSDKLKGELIQKGVDESLIKTLHWFGFTEIEKTWSLRKTAKDPRYVLCPFRFHFQKRPTFVCDIAAELCRILTAAHMPIFLLVGDGELYSKIKDRAKALKVSHWIQFKRGVTYDQMSSLYKGASALVCPSVDEGIPLTYFEAMQWSVPLAVSNVGAVSELVPTNYLIDFETEDEAKKYAELLSLHLTGKSRAEIRDARELVNDKFSKGVWEDKVERIIR